ncbi:MAG: Regulator, partial [Bacteroidetes bacterium]|nr:Regulator [Bacteroidota bacterium]
LTNMYVSGFAVTTGSPTNLFAGTGAGVFRSTDNGASWTVVGLNITNVKSLAVSAATGGVGPNLFAGTLTDGVFRSIDNGSSWIWASTGLTLPSALSFAVSGDSGALGMNLFAGTLTGVFLSTNHGTNWTTTGLRRQVNSLVISSEAGGSGMNLFAGSSNGVFLSTDTGISWTWVSEGLTNTFVWSLAATHAMVGSGMTLFAGTEGGAFLSTDKGTSWTAARAGLTDTVVRSLAVSPSVGGSGTNLFAGTFRGGVFLSTNNGTSWTAVNTGLPPNTTVSVLAVSGSNLFAGTSSGVFLSTNSGTSWSAWSTGLTNTYVWSLAVSANNLFAGTSGGVWRRTFPEASVRIPSSDLPTDFSLDQNYPNPFNPATTINYQSPITSHVSLKILDLLGREVAALVNEEKPAGSYKASWDAAKMPSGVYFYRLNAGEFVETKKMVLLR